MKKTVLTFGLISGLVMVVLMCINMSFWTDTTHFENGELLGYTTMVIALSVIYFAVRSYRDKELGGTITFGKAFQVGLLIALIASVFYVVGWKVYSHYYLPDYMERYMAHTLDKLHKSGAPATEIRAKEQEMRQFMEMYKNPVIEFGMVFLEIFPVGLLISLLSAALLRRKPLVGAAA